MASSSESGALIRALRLLTFPTAFLLFSVSTPAQIIVEERDVPRFHLPDILLSPGGRSIWSFRDWEQCARPRLLETFETYVYGRTPRIPIRFSATGTVSGNPDDPDGALAEAVGMSVQQLETREVFGGTARLSQVRIEFTRHENAASFEVLILLPAKHEGPVSTILALNFWGNHTINANPAIRIAPTIPQMEERERGSHAHRWNLECLIERGYGVATAFRGEIAPDHGEHFAEGVLTLFPENEGPSRMGAIGTWAWALSRIADYLVTVPEIDPRGLVVAGHSRLAKAALWAAAQDERFSAVFANNSGCMGAALSRRRFGETVAIITRNFPYWFSPRLQAFADREGDLPVDQHQLLALLAPRPLHLGAAREDLWADPRGEFLALREAARVYALFDREAALPQEMPPPDARAVGQTLRFHLREGPHDLLAEDWEAFLDAREGRRSTR